MIVVECPKCKQKYKVEEDYFIPVGGAPVRCPQCGNVFTIFIEPIEINMIPIDDNEYNNLSSQKEDYDVGVQEDYSSYEEHIEDVSANTFAESALSETSHDIDTDFGGISTTEEIEPVSEEELEISRIEGETEGDVEEEITLGDIAEETHEEEKEESIPSLEEDTLLSPPNIETEVKETEHKEEITVDEFTPPPLMDNTVKVDEVKVEEKKEEELLPPPPLMEDLTPPPITDNQVVEEKKEIPVEDDLLPPPPPLTPPPVKQEEVKETTKTNDDLLPPPPPIETPKVEEPTVKQTVEKKEEDKKVGGIDFTRTVGVLSNASPEERAKNKARRLARSLVKDILLYKGKEVEEGYKNGTIKEVLKEEIKKCYKYYVSEVNPDIAQNETFFVDELNKIIGKGEKIWTKDEVKQL